MGIIDSTAYRLTCKSCGKIEAAVAHEYGSAYSGGTWSYPKASTFLLETKEVAGEQVVQSGTCPCGGRVEVEIVPVGPLG